MYETAHIGLKEAQLLVESVLQRAGAAPPIAVAVVDRDGSLIAFARMDRTPTIVGEMALNKAYTAARLGVSTLEVAARLRREELQLSIFGDQSFTYFGGGVPLRFDGQVAAGLGVSGRTEEGDQELCEQALRALGALSDNG